MDRLFRAVAGADHEAIQRPMAEDENHLSRGELCRRLNAWAQVSNTSNRLEAVRLIMQCWDQSSLRLDLRELALDELPELVGNFYQLREIDLADNHLRDLPQRLERLTLLNMITLINNDFTHLPDVLYDLPDQSTVMVGGNNIPQHAIQQFEAIVAEEGGPALFQGDNSIYSNDWPEAQLAQAFGLSLALDAWRPDVGADEHADAFGVWLNRLNESTEGESPNQRELINERISALLNAMNEDATLRERFVYIAHEATASCDDNVLLGLNRLEMALQNHLADKGELDQTQLLDLGRGMFRLAELDKIANEKVAALGERADPVEVHLAYQVGLRDRMHLPLVVTGMHFAQIAQVDEIDLEHAVRSLEQREGGPAAVDLKRFEHALKGLTDKRDAQDLPNAATWHPLAAYLAKDYTPWQQHITRHYAAEASTHTALMYAHLEHLEQGHEAGLFTEGEYVRRVNIAQVYANSGLAYAKALECLAALNP